jgi:hypothetical protein
MAARRDINELASYLRSNPVAQMYHCWDGTEPEPMACRSHATIDMIESRDFYFKDREFLTVSATSDLSVLEPASGYQAIRGASNRPRHDGQQRTAGAAAA